MHIPSILITLVGLQQPATIPNTKEPLRLQDNKPSHLIVDNGVTIKLGTDASNNGIYYVAWETSADPCSLLKRAVIGTTPCGAVFNLIDKDGNSLNLLQFDGCHGRGTDISVEKIVQGPETFATCEPVEDADRITCPPNPWDGGEDIYVTYVCQSLG